MRRRARQSFKPAQFNVLEGMERVKQTNWTKRWTQPILNCYYHDRYEQAQGFNYHISVYKVQNRRAVDHHATLDYQGQRIHYGFLRDKESDQQVWVNDVDPEDPKQLKIIELFQLFEAEKNEILPRDLVNRLSVPQE